MTSARFPTSVVPLAVAFALALPGCIAPAADAPLEAASTGVPTFAAFTPPVPDFDFATVVDADHASHQAPMLHAGGHGLELVGHTGIQAALPPGTRGSITQVDVWGDYAVVSGMEGGLAFAILDIADPAAPKVVSSWPANADGWTARFSDDGQYVFYGCQVLGPLGAGSGGALWKDCVDTSSVGPGYERSGVVVVDVTDKASPEFVAFAETKAAHNLFVASIGGYDWAFTNGVDIVRFDRATGKAETVANVPGVHDATVARHPVTGDWLLYTGTDELAIYDVDDPANPTPVFEGGVDGPDGKAVGWHEQTVVPGLVDGRYLLVLAGESFTGGAEPGMLDVVSFVDVTDPTNPTFLSSWVPPFKPAAPWVSYLYSVHEIAATPTGQVAVAWYHAGAWVLDVSTKERQAEPVVLAAYLPNKPIDVVPATFVQTAVPVVPFVWGAGWDDRGYLVVPDMHTGVYLLEPEWGLVQGLDGGQ